MWILVVENPCMHVICHNNVHESVISEELSIAVGDWGNHQTYLREIV